MTALQPRTRLYCRCGAAVIARRIASTCEGARFTSGVCPRSGALVIRSIPIRGVPQGVADMPASDRPPARPPKAMSDSPGASASGVFA